MMDLCSYRDSDPENIDNPWVSRMNVLLFCYRIGQNNKSLLSEMSFLVNNC